MNPAMQAGASAGLGGAITTVASWVGTDFLDIAVPDNVAVAIGVILTSAISYIFHRRSQMAAAPAVSSEPLGQSATAAPAQPQV